MAFKPAVKQVSGDPQAVVALLDLCSPDEDCLSAADRCLCGCGSLTKIAARSRTGKGYVIGAPHRFIPGHQRRLTTPAYREEDRGYTTPCWIWLRFIDAGGYGRTFYAGKQAQLAHRVYYEMHRGKLPPSTPLNHLCRIRACVNPAHLEPTTSSRNTRLGSSAKLTYAQVSEIRSRFGLETHRELALRYGVTAGAIGKIAQGITWVENPKSEVYVA